MKLTLPITKKEVELKDFVSRKIDREYMILLTGKSDATTDIKWNPSMKVNMEDVQIAYDYLVEAMTNLSKEEIDDLPKKDFDFLQSEIEKVKTPSE